MAQAAAEPLMAGGTLKVLIVEDDPVVASVYQQTVGAINRLDVAGTVTRGEDALLFLQRKHCDLILLDLKLAGMSGVTLLQRLRENGDPIEVIALTASRNARTVRRLVQYGVVDYLVKPFTVERLRQSIGRYLYRVAAYHHDELTQDAVDQICGASRGPKRWLPKGLTEDGVKRVCEALNEGPGTASASDIAESTGLARVTARRYLEYLVAIDQAYVDAVPSGPGRPRKLYYRRPRVTVGD